MQVIEKDMIDPFWYRNYTHTQLLTDMFYSSLKERFPNKFEELMSLVEKGDGEIYKSTDRYFIGIKDPEVAQEFSTLFKQLRDRYGAEAVYTNAKKYDIPLSDEFELPPLPEGAVEIDLDKESAFYFLRKYTAIHRDSEEYNVSLEDVFAGVVGVEEPSSPPDTSTTPPSENGNVGGRDLPPEGSTGGRDASPPSQDGVAGGRDVPSTGGNDVSLAELEKRIKEVIAKYQLPVDKIVKEIIDVIT